mmetsp:Transcript_20289/g.46033  ORF Transcript_20289/g.46033 Transcript_20289/m.46033 type:complete len:616 (-) Transcript_20289:288-2135(-)
MFRWCVNKFKLKLTFAFKTSNSSIASCLPLSNLTNFFCIHSAQYFIHPRTKVRRCTLFTHRSVRFVFSQQRVWCSIKRELEKPQTRAHWMSGKQGISFHIPGGTNAGTNRFDAKKIARQLKNKPISYVIFCLSSGAAGDRYLAPHPIFKQLGMKAVTPKNVNTERYNPKNRKSKFVRLERYKDIDVFGRFLNEMKKINVKVIAYMNVQGPPMLKHGEARAFDHPANTVGFHTGGYFVNNRPAVCQKLGKVDRCAPSVRKWVNWVARRHKIFPYNFRDTYVQGSRLNRAVKAAYANVVVGYYAKKYGSRIAGFWFDAGRYGDRAKIVAAVRRHNPRAAIAYNQGAKIPLRNNNRGYEDYTFGHMTPEHLGANPPDGCYNYGMVLSAENSVDGYVYTKVTPKGDLSNASVTNPYTRKGFKIRYTRDSYPSLAHVFLPAQLLWYSGKLVWNTRQAAEWVHRVTRAGGAFTWSVRRSGCNGCTGNSQSIIDPPVLNFLRNVYKQLPIRDKYRYGARNCACRSELGTTGNRKWGCPSIRPSRGCRNNPRWTFRFAGNVHNCDWLCKSGASSSSSLCKASTKGTKGVNAIRACPYCCKRSCPGYSRRFSLLTTSKNETAWL